MKDGVYATSVNVNGIGGFGRLTMQDRCGHGGDGRFQFEVHVRGSGNELSGIVNLLMDPGLASHLCMPHHCSFDVTGSGSESTFNLIGTARPGVIVEIEAVPEGTALDRG